MDLLLGCSYPMMEEVACVEEPILTLTTKRGCEFELFIALYPGVSRDVDSKVGSTVSGQYASYDGRANGIRSLFRHL